MKLNFSPKLFLVLIAVSATQLLQAQVVRPFNIYYQNNQKGGIVYISNVSVSCGSATGCAAAEAELAPAGNTQNNDFIQDYVDVDNDGTTFMSSSDSLNLPACSNITYAGLFWGGSVNNATPNFANRSKVKIKANNGSYVEIDADSLVSNNSGSITYHCYKNITSLAQANGKFARYTVADLVTQTGSANRFGGWTIVVAYRNDLENLKNLTVFGGVANISVGFTPVQIDLTGFLTPPTGPVTLELGVVAYDGDRGFFQDSLYFNGAGTYVSVDNVLNPTRDIFNSTISNNGVENPFRSPLLHNTMGWDADIFSPNNTTKNFIGNNATAASLRLTTGNENYYAQVVTTAIDVYEPDIRVGNTTIDLNGAPLNPGDTLEYTVTIQNLGSDTAINSTIVDTIPFNLDYVSNSIRVVAGPNQGNKTDAFGDDQGDFDVVGNRVVVRVGNGANATLGGGIADNPTGADSTTIKFRATVTQECVKLRCSGFVNSLASGVATGQLSGNTQTNFSNPSILDGQGCPIPGFTSTLINLPPSCALPPDTAFSSCPPFLFSSLTTALPGYVYFSPTFNPIAVATTSATYFGIKTLTTGCTDTIALTITIFPNPAFTSVTKTNPTCGLPTSGSFVLNGISATDSIAFTLGNTHNNASQYVVVSSLNPANTYDTLTAGDYTVRLKNATNCTIDQVINLAPAVNCAPTAGDESFTTTEDTPLNADVSANDGDLNGDPLTFTVLTNPAHGTVLLNLNGTFVYTPNLNYNGPDTLSYLVCDNGAPALCDTGMVLLTVTPINDAPIAVDDTESINEDIPLNSTVAANDTDIEGNTLEFAILTAPSSGAVILNTDGTYTYTPNANFNGTDSFTYTVCDDGIPSLCDTGLVSITINAVNDAPLAVDDSFLGGLNLNVSGDVSPNDSDVDGDPLTFTLILNPDSGSVLFNSDGTFIYTPNSGFTGNDTLVYTVCDTGAPSLCDTALVVIGVNTSNISPVAVDDNNIITDEDTAVNGDVSTNDFDPNTDPLSYSLLTNASNGTVTINSNGTFTYTPALNFNGTDSFTYLVCDNGTPSLCDSATATITVNPINDAPVALDDAVFGGFNLAVSGNTSSNDFDVDGDPLTFTMIVSPDSGSIIFNPNGTFTFTPNNNFIGNDTLVYTVCDTGAPTLCDTAIVVIGVNTANLAPLAANDSLTITDEDTAVSGDVSSNDSDPNGDPLSFSLLTNPGNGSVVVNLNGTFTYTPNLNFNGIDSFTYLVCDNGAPALCDSATVSITVNPVNDAPLAIDDVSFTPINASVIGDVSPNDSDVDGDTLGFSVLINPTNGTVLMSSNGQYSYTPNNGFVGNDTLTYLVCDTATPSLCDTAIVVIGVNVQNVSPLAGDDNFSTNEDTPLLADVSLNDTDPNQTPLSYSLLTNAGSGTVVVNPDGTFTYTPSANFNGNDSFTYLVCDAGAPALCDTATVFITVLPINDAPVAIDDANTTNTGLVLAGTVASNDFDVDGDTLTFSTSTVPNFGTIILNNDGTYSYTPNGTVGTDTIVYVVCDNGTPALCDTGLLIINVIQLIAPPTATDDSFTTNEDTPLSADVSTNDLTNGSTVAYSVLVNALQGLVVMNANGTFTYTPVANYNGPDSFTYLICDNGLPAACDTAVVSITVTPVNDAPVAVDDLSNTNQNVAVSGDVSINDSDVDGDPLTFAIIALPLHGIVVFNPNGTFTYTPTTGYSGPDTLTYSVCDNGTPALCDTAIVVFNIIGIIVLNQPPVATPDTLNTVEDTPLNGDVSLNDVDPNITDILSFTLFVNVTNGVLTLNTNGSFSYTPALNFNGTDSFTYVVCDNGIPSLCDTTTVSITVSPVNDGPIAVDDIFSTPFNTILNADVSPNDSDVDGNTLSYTVITNPSNGTLLLNANGTFTYTPNSGFTGTDTFVYNACDNGTPQLCDSAIVTIDVAPNTTFPLVGVAKSVSNPVAQGNSFVVTYTVVIKNYGTAIASNVQVTDDLVGTFPAPVAFTVTNITSTVLSVNPLFNGITSTNLLEPLTNQLAPGASDTIRFTLLVSPSGSFGPFNNTAIASATSSAPDLSVDGSNPDPNGDSNPNEAGVTPLSFPNNSIFQIGLSKTAAVSDIKSDGTFDVTYTFDIQNMGNVVLNNIDLIDDLVLTFPAPVTFSVISVLANGGLSANANYTGVLNSSNLLIPSASAIAVGLTNSVVLKLNVNTNGDSGTYLNTADAYAKDAQNNIKSKDKSNNVRIDNNLNGNPSDQGEDVPTPVTLDGKETVEPIVIVIPQGFTPDENGQNDNFVIPGIGNYPENELTIYNRWGNIVYQKTGYDNSWNGISDKGNGKVTQGTYYYVLELNKDELEARKGYVVIEY